MDTVLDIRNLTVGFQLSGHWYPALRNVDLSIRPNETLALVGESGSGKSVTALSTMRLLPSTGARVTSGEIRYGGRNLLQIPENEMCTIRGNEIAMVFQEPMTSLNPTMKIGKQISEVVKIHKNVDERSARARARELLDEVKVPDAARRLDDYPHQFSGGMRQRVGIAIALAGQPKLLLADEPTTALDVTVQAQILKLLDELKKSHGMAIMFITHDLSVVAQFSDRVSVMYAGEIVETAPTRQLFGTPVHPYTEALLAATPRVDRDTKDLEPIPGIVPSISMRPKGCQYRPRCQLARDICHDDPVLALTAQGTEVRCFVKNITTAQP